MLEARVRVRVRSNAAVVGVDVDVGKVLMVDECGSGDGSGNGDGDGTRDGRYGVQARQARTPRPSPRMMQSWHLLSLILIGLRCGGFIIRVQDFSLQPADVRGRTRTRLVPAMTQWPENEQLTNWVYVVPAEQTVRTQAILLASRHGNEVLAREVKPSVDDL